MPNASQIFIGAVTVLPNPLYQNYVIPKPIISELWYCLTHYIRIMVLPNPLYQNYDIANPLYQNYGITKPIISELW